MSNPVENKPSEFNQTDNMIERSRASRALVAILSPILALGVSYLLGVSFSAFFKFPHLLGQVIGLGLGAVVATWFISKSYIVNDAVAAFVTIDPLVTVFGGSDALVSYGPGFHLCYWWEKRAGGNNVDLTEAAENYEFQVQTKTGTIRGKYSVRLRPDIRMLPEFLAGVASVAADLGGIITATIVELLSDKTVDEALSSVNAINEALKKKFEHGSDLNKKVSGFEGRFGVIVGDITLSQILPSEEVQKAKDGASESLAINQIVARNLGYASIEAVQEAVASKDLKPEQVAYATENALAMTDNLHGMDLKRQTFTLKVEGVDGLTEAVKALAPIAPAIVGALNKGSGPKKPASKQTSTKGTK